MSSKDATVICPKCSAEFSITGVVEQKVRAQLDAEYDKKLKAVEEGYETRQKEIEANASREKDNLRKAQENIDQEVASRLKDSQRRLKESIRQTVANELEETKLELGAQSEKLRVAQSKELELRKLQRQLEAEKSEFDLKLARQLDEERNKIKNDAESKINEAHKLRELEWEEKQRGMEKAISDLKQKAEQGSMQTQGEVLELEIENSLKEIFPWDTIEEVSKGAKGGDIKQTVKTRGGTPVGLILWESKRTKSWSDQWIPKLKDDQRTAKANITIIVSTVLPDGIQHIGQVDSVWVTDVQSFQGLALALRCSLLKLAQAQQAQIGKKEKAEEVYEYLNGVEFKGRIQGLVESFVAMKEGLEKERRSYEKLWGERDKQLTRALNSTAGMYGDLAGLIGPSLQEIPQLSLEVK